MARTDIHKPSSIVVEDYYFVAIEHAKIETLGDCFVAEQNREILRQHKEKTGGNFSRHDHGGTCMICGNVMCIYTAAFYHAKTNSYIRVGFTCAEKMEMGDSLVFQSFKKACKDAKEAKAGKNKAAQILKEADLLLVWDVVCNPEKAEYQDKGIQNQIYTIKDIVGKLVRYGSISESQMEFLAGLQKQVAEWEETKAKRAEERKNAEDVLTGRVEITGVIVKTDTKYNQFGERFVMTVKDDRGFLVWGTQPPSIKDSIKGSRVTFTATVEPSDKDAKFGFFKRPTKAEIINEVRAQ